MSAIRLSIIVPTIGRPTLATALRSIVTQTTADDEILVVGAAGADEAARVGARYLLTRAGGCWGYQERTAALGEARGTHLVWVDDDDALLPGALAVIRQALAEAPDRPHVFRMIAPWGELLPRAPVVAEGNIGGPQIVVPNVPDRLGRFGLRYEGDYDFLISTLARYPEGASAIVWRPEIIYGARQYGQRAWTSAILPPDRWRLLVVHPGASWATADVYDGLIAGLRACGARVAEFRLDGRLERAHGYLHYLWRQIRRRHPDHPLAVRPSGADVIYEACRGLVERALARHCTDILIVSAMYVTPDVIVLAHRAGLRVWLLCTESPYAWEEEARIARLVDGVWTHERTAVEAFRAITPHVAYLPHAWRPGVHDQAPDPQAPSCDVLFIGTGFRERIRWLSAVDWSGIDLALYGYWEELPRRSPLRRAVRGAIVPNRVAIQLAQRAKLALNLYREPPAGRPAESLNPRAYELAAAGVPTISTWRAESVERFGDAVPLVHDPAALATVVREQLADEDGRQRLAARAHAAVAADTWLARAAQVLRDLDRWTQARRPVTEGVA